jgi:peptidoglycan hydrolase-like protein with peptidoglycan-binding domain
MQKFILKYWYLIVLGLLAIAAGIYFYSRKKEKELSVESSTTPTPTPAPTPTPGQTSSTTAPTVQPIDYNLVLSRGSRGREVSLLQSYLNNIGENLQVDGIFGALTETSLKNRTGYSSITLNQFRALPFANID